MAVKEGIKKAQKQPEDKKVEAKVDDKLAAKPTDDKTVELKQPDIKVEDKKPDDKKVADELDKRVYDDIPESLRPIFKKLHNEPFNTFKPLIKELETTKAELETTKKSLQEVKKGALPDNYYEHEQGYILAPEFTQASNIASRAEQIANHWESQFERIRKGEATYQEVEINPRTGELYLSAPLAVTPQSEKQVESWMKGSQSQLMERQFAVRSIAEKHATTHKESVSQVNDFEKAAFKVFSEGDNAKSWEPVVKDTITKTFPAPFRNNPLASGYAKALLTIDILGKQLKALKDGKPAEVKTDDGKKVSVDDKKKAGPSAGDMANAGGGGASKDDDEVTIDDFKAVKERGQVYVRK